MNVRLSCALFFVVFQVLVSAQPHRDMLEAAMATIVRMGRERPPEATLHYIDSLSALPDLANDPYYQMGFCRFRGEMLRLLGRWDAALVNQQRAFELADSMGNVKARGDAQLAIAFIHMDRGQADEARGTLLALYRAGDVDQSDDFRVPMTLGVLADMSGLPDSAAYWYLRTLPLAEAAQDSFAVCDVLYNLGLTHAAMERPSDAERFLERALKSLPHDGYPQLELRVYAALARSHLNAKRYAEVPAMLDRAERMALENDAGDVLTEVLADRMELHALLGNAIEAVDVAKRLLHLKDSLSTAFSDKALAEAEAQFGVTRIEKELALTKAEAEVNALRAQRSWIAWSALAVIVVLAIVLIMQYRRRYHAKKKAALVLEGDKVRLLEENELLHQENLMARFETLKSQIDPHFLFNAMNTLYTLVETEPKKAREFVSSFSALYRKVLTSRERTIVPVQEELELVHHYLFLQRIRFGESLQVKVEVPADALKGYLPPFTLQMLLENAIKHNVISAAHPLHITITVEGGQLIVRNDLLPRATKETGTGTGLENIRRRYIMLGAPEPLFNVADPYYTAAVPILSPEP